MASPEWIEIFRSYSPEELATHVTNLKAEISVYSTQSVGQKSYAKDLAELRGQLSAAVRVQNERKTSGNSSIGIVDFSKV